MKKIVSFILLLGILLSSLVIASAGNVPIDPVTFSDTDTTLEVAKGKKSDDEQYWYLKLTSNSNKKNNPSKTNIFGARVWVDGNRGSTYRTFDYIMKKAQKFDYYSSANACKNSKVKINGKKDDSSTSKNKLIIRGTFCP